MKTIPYSEFPPPVINKAKDQFIAHFDKIYECNELTDHELKIIYLAYLWSKGLAGIDSTGEHFFDETNSGVSLADYELTFEAETSGGINFYLTHEYYYLDQIMAMLEDLSIVD